MKNTSSTNPETKQSVYAIVTERIVNALAAGTVPWNQPWCSTPAPRNFLSNQPYRGMNHLLLRLAGRSTPYWLTFQQIQMRGGTIKAGERGMPITFWKSPDKERDGDNARATLRYYRVFNFDQTEGMPPCPEEAPGAGLEPKAAAEAIIRAMPNAPKISKSGDAAFYSVSEDRVNMPQMKKFRGIDAYYSVFFHELTHSTRHSSRLNRTYRNEAPDAPRPFGSTDYSREELVAELGAAFLCASCGIENTVEQSAAYIQGWMAAIAEDEKLIVHAAAAAQRAADFILAIPPSHTTNTPYNTSSHTSIHHDSREAVPAAQ